MESAEESKAKNEKKEEKKIFELQQNKAEREEEIRKDHDKLVEEAEAARRRREMPKTGKFRFSSKRRRT